MERPRLVVFSPVYPPRKGGAATYFSNLASLLRDDIDITVVCMREDELPQEEWIDGIKVLRVLPDEYDSSTIKRLLKVVPRSFSVLSDLKKEGAFVLQAHSNGIYGLSASLFSKVLSVPMIKEVQDTSDIPWNLKMGNVKWWVSCGDHIKQRLAGMNIPKERIKAFTIVNPPWFRKKVEELGPSVKRNDKTVTMVYVGWLLNRVKGVDDLIRAFRKAYDERKDLSLIVIGDGPDRKELEKMAEGYPVTFTGELDQEEVIKWYLRSHFTIMASHEEAAGRIYTEGYEAGIPAVGNDVGGSPEVLKDGRTGILVPDGDIEKMKDAILKLAGDNELRKEMGENGRRFLDDIPGWETIRDWYISRINEIWNEMK